MASAILSSGRPASPPQTTPIQHFQKFELWANFLTWFSKKKSASTVVDATFGRKCFRSKMFSAEKYFNGKNRPKMFSVVFFWLENGVVPEKFCSRLFFDRKLVPPPSAIYSSGNLLRGASTLRNTWVFLRTLRGQSKSSIFLTKRCTVGKHINRYTCL